MEWFSRCWSRVVLLSAMAFCANLSGSASANDPPKYPERTAPVSDSRGSGSAASPATSADEKPSTPPAASGGSDLLSGLVGAVVGAIIAAIASLAAVAATERASRRREGEREARQNASLRVILRTEIDQNLRLLEDDQKTVTDRQDNTQGSTVESYSKGYVFGFTPSPPWNTTAWEHAVSMLGTALTDEELRRIQRFYANLLTLSAQRAMIASLALRGDLSRTATDYKEKVADGIVALTNSVLSEGNPLSAAPQSRAEGDASKVARP